RSSETTLNRNSSVPNPNNQPMDYEKEPLFALILRLFLMACICYFAIPQPRLWPAPALFALVWRAGTEYPDLGMMTVIAAAVVATGGGWCAMYNDGTPEALEMGVDTVGAIVAGVVALSEVWGFLMRAGRDRRRKFWREEARAEAARGGDAVIDRAGDT